jgi:uncharacterized delta-60 repeat protein
MKGPGGKLAGCAPSTPSLLACPQQAFALKSGQRQSEMKTRNSGCPFSINRLRARPPRRGSSILNTLCPILAWALRLGAAVLPVACAIAQPGSVDLTFDPGLGPDGEVKAVGIQSNGKIVIGGLFTHVYPTNQSGIARLNPDGSLDTSFRIGSGASGRAVTNLWVLPDDRIMIAGPFTSFNGTNRTYVARLNSDGSLDLSFSASLSISYDSILTVQNDGRPIDLDWPLGFSIYRLNVDGTFDPSFNVFSSPFVGGASQGPPPANCAVQPDNKIILGGAYFARLHANGSFDTGQTNVALSYDETVTAVAFQNDGKIIVGGNFTKFAGVPRNYLARANSDMSLDPAFDAGTNLSFPPTCLLLQPDGKLVVNGAMRLNLDGSQDNFFNPGTGPNYTVDAMALAQDGKIIIVGAFTSVNGTPRRYVARLNSDPAAAPSFAAPPTSQTAMAGRNPFFFENVSGTQPLTYQWLFNGVKIPWATNNVLVLSNVQFASTGQYSLQASNAQGPLTSTNATLNLQRASVFPGSADISGFTGAGADSVVEAIASGTNGDVWIGGLFTQYAGTPCGGVVHLNSDGSLANVPAIGPASVYAIAVQNDGKILIGGSFATVNGAAHYPLVRLNPDGTVDSAFKPYFAKAANYAPSIYALAPQNDGKLLVAGDFTNVNGIVRYALARLSSDGSLDTTFNANLFSSVIGYALALQPDGKVVLGGANVYYLGPGPFFGRFASNGALDFTNVYGGNGPVLSVALQTDRKILVGGQLDYGIMRLLPSGSQDTNFNLGWTRFSNGSVYALATQADGKILAGGSFLHFNGFARRHIMRVNGEGTMDTVFDTSGAADGKVRCLAALPNGKTLVGGEFASINGCERHGIARLNGDVRILSSQRAGGVFNAPVLTDIGKNYTLEYIDVLVSGNWLPLPTIAGNGSIRILTDTTSTGPKRFYRVRVE